MALDLDGARNLADQKLDAPLRRHLRDLLLPEQSTMVEPGDGLARRFDRMDAVSRFPVLVFNGVSALSGNRILAAGLTENLNLLNIAKVRPPPFSAAVGISTRFPFIEPAGSVYDRTGHFYDSVVRDGYVENFGSNSALVVLKEIGNLIRDDREPHPSRVRQFIRNAVFVQISSDRRSTTGRISRSATASVRCPQFRSAVGMYGLARHPLT
jgi:hypothetical protein